LRMLMKLKFIDKLNLVDNFRIIRMIRWGRVDRPDKVARRLSQRKLSDFVFKLSDRVMIEGIEVCKKGGEFEGIANLLECKLSTPVRAAVESTLIERSKVCVRGRVGLEVQVESSLTEKSEVCRKKDRGWIDSFAGFLGHKLSASARETIESLLIEGIRICENKGCVHAIVKLLARESKNFSIAVRAQAQVSLLRVANAFTFVDCIAKTVASVLNLEDFKDDVIAGIKRCENDEKWIRVITTGSWVSPPIVTTIESTEEAHEICGHTSLALSCSCENWSLAVIEAINAKVPIGEWHPDQIANLLKRTDLAPQMRKEAEEALPIATERQKQKETPKEVLTHWDLYGATNIRSA